MKTVIRSFLRYLPRRLSLSILQIVGVACGVAAVVGMTLSAETALKGFTQALQFLQGRATHSMQRIAGPMDEQILQRLSRDPAVDRFSPVIDRQLRLSERETVRLLGIDPFLDQAIRPEISRAGIREKTRMDAEKIFAFLLEERAVLIDRGLAEQRGLAAGGSLGTTRGELRVLGTFPNPSGEPLILMDIAHAQQLFALEGKIDRIDLILSDDAGFRQRWKEGFLIQSGLQKGQTLSSMLTAFRLNLEALSLLALFVGVFLIYNTAMFAVVSRRRDTGIFRSLGAKRSEMVVAFLTEILVLGVIGGAAGGAIGYFLARLLTGMIGDSISNLYFFLRPQTTPWTNWIVGSGILLGCGAALLGAAVPLAELIRTDPISALSGRAASRQSARKAKNTAVAGLAVLAASLVLLLLPGAHIYVSFLGVFGFIVGVSLLVGIVLLRMNSVLRSILHLLGRLPGKIAAGNIRQNLGRTSVAIAAFMVALSMSIGLGAMIGSFRHSLIWWMDTQIKGDLYIGRIGEAEVPEDFYEELKKIPGLDGVHPYRNVQVFYRGIPISLSAVGAAVLQRYTHFGWLRGGNENWDLVKQGAVVISESFARRFGTREGDTIVLEGLRGPVELKVAAIFYDYTTEHGLVMMDRSTYLGMFEDHTINDVGVFIDPANPRRSELLQEVKARAQSRGLPVLSQAQFHSNILEVFDTTFAVTRSMRAIAIVVAFFGIAGALLTLFMERRREFGIYRALGFSTGQVATMTLLEGLGMGGISYMISIGVGTALAVVLIKVINLKSFNWTIFFYPSLETYLWTAGIAILASVGAALYPIWKVCRTYPQMQIREE